MQPNPSTPSPIDQHIAKLVAQVNDQLERHLPPESMAPRRLHAAMRYAVLGGGKRMRPLFVYGAAEALAASPESADPLACAVELIHAYSLIHDDLPVMDDDDLRRGRPTCHRAFDEATAVLAGDALQALAFDVLVSDLPPSADAAGLVTLLARSCGSRGMAGGQAVDLEAVGESMGLEALKNMHELKTGALITCAVELPAVLHRAGQAQRDALRRYGQCIGLAFQIHDDVLDIEGDTAEIGKPQGSDQEQNKPTFPACVGLEASRKMAGDLFQEAMDCLSALPGSTGLLEYLARFTVERSR
ncbi:MAG: polyprenyl synthetase family protein [Xanthomonadales bacterium]|nr:polyprenyl synthetase family protein [Xanthomonadales bacterium]